MMHARSYGMAMLVLTACSGARDRSGSAAQAEATAAARADSAAASAAPAPRALPAGVSAADVARGRATFATVCAVCHGPDARGTQLGPSLVASDSMRAASLDSVVALVRGGIPAGDPIGMPAYAGELDDGAIRAVSAYVVALRAR